MIVSKILVFDTSVATENLGDLIILDAVRSHLRGLFPGSYFSNTSTHEVIGRLSYRLNRIADYSFVAGTNLLCSNMDSYNQWKINLFDALFIRNIILMGVGWWQYQKDPNFYTQFLYKIVLHKKILHSVRDGYALNKLRAAGFQNVINTGCPTTWDLTPGFCSGMPRTKAEDVVFTLTDYNRNNELDKKLIATLRRHYLKVYYWPQGAGDLEYLGSLGSEGIKSLNPSLEAYDQLLASSNSLDYVGTRLHAGIRALQHKRRSIILAVDNRATEMHKDINLPVVQRTDVTKLVRMIKGAWDPEIRINEEAILSWKAQFIS
ncbi:MAG: polysaccharide pyruvyl transferase family protein [Rhodocyclaceae bacterium]|nr:polysaccharide pyruvyl transferase family protein [Rhodocyclaceae bacterium]